MTQRIFDVENKKDMQDLWDILPENVAKIIRNEPETYYLVKYTDSQNVDFLPYAKINWHDKTEITRPIQEATEQDIGKLCAFWDIENPAKYDIHYGIFTNKVERFYELELGPKYNHCRRLTKQEIEELC